MFPIKYHLNVQPLTLIMYLGKLFSRIMIFLQNEKYKLF